MISKVNGSLWINGCVNFNRDFTIPNLDFRSSRFHCKTIVLQKVFNTKLYNIKSTKSIFLHPVQVQVVLQVETTTKSHLSLYCEEDIFRK